MAEVLCRWCGWCIEAHAEPRTHEGAEKIRGNYLIPLASCVGFEAEIDDLCLDCKVNTFKIHEYYMVEDAIWEAAVPDTQEQEGKLCIGCLERRLGRELKAADFTPYPINTARKIRSARLTERLHSK